MAAECESRFEDKLSDCPCLEAKGLLMMQDLGEQPREAGPTWLH